MQCTAYSLGVSCSGVDHVHGRSHASQLFFFFFFLSLHFTFVSAVRTYMDETYTVNELRRPKAVYRYNRTRDKTRVESLSGESTRES
jgi:hypothetical protein